MRSRRHRHSFQKTIVLFSVVFIVGGGCQWPDADQNAPGFPSRPGYGVPAPAPTPGGSPAQQVGAVGAAGGSSFASTSPAGGVPLPPTTSGTGSASAERGNGNGPSAMPVVTVTITVDGRFDPADVTIRPGEAIRWQNMNRSPQTVTADPARAQDRNTVVLPPGAEAWSSGPINHDADFTRRFPTSGEYRYFSMPGETRGATGRIVVQG